MKIKYKFKVHGRIKPTEVFPLYFDDRVYTFDVVNKFLKNIIVTFPISEKNYPSVIQSPNEEVSLHINLNDPDIAHIKQEMRQIEGLLSIYGCEFIDSQNPVKEWVAETEEEKTALQLYSWTTEIQETPDDEILPLQFDLIARPVLAAAKHQHELPAFSFHRKARNDMKKNRYIDAIYDFFYCLEYEFGEGKTRNNMLKEAFLQCEELTNSINSAKSDKLVLGKLSPKERLFFEEKYTKKDIQNNVNDLILLRGFLHHQSGKRKDTWGADEHDRFKAEALFLQLIVFNIVMKRYNDLVSDAQVIELYEKCYHENHAKE